MASSQPTARFIDDRVPHTTSADWVHVSNVSPGAKEVYHLLTVFAESFHAAHRDEPTTAQATVAEVLCMSQPWVSARVKELRDLGAVETIPFKGPGGGYIYGIRRNPPEGYTGPVTLADRLLRRPAANDAAAIANDGEGSVRPAARTNGATTNAPNDERRRADERSANAAPTNGTNVRAAFGETFAGTNDAPRTTNEPADDGPFAEAVASLLAEAEEVGMFEEDATAPRKLRAKIIPLLEAGHTVSVIRKEMIENLGGAEKRIAVAMTRLTDLSFRRPRRAPAQRQGGPRCDKGLGHDTYPADNCLECKINARDEAADEFRRSAATSGLRRG